MAGVYTQNSQQVRIIVGPNIVLGFEKASATPRSDVASSKQGVTGETAQSIMAKPDWDVTIDMFQASPSNQVLYELYLATVSTGVNFPLLYENPSAGFSLSGEAWVEVIPPMEGDKEQAAVQWRLVVHPDSTTKYGVAI